MGSLLQSLVGFYTLSLNQLLGAKRCSFSFISLLFSLLLRLLFSLLESVPPNVSTIHTVVQAQTLTRSLEELLFSPLESVPANVSTIHTVVQAQTLTRSLEELLFLQLKRP